MNEESQNLAIVVEHNLGRAEILAAKLREAYQHLVTPIEPDKAGDYLIILDASAQAGEIGLMLIGNPVGYYLEDVLERHRDHRIPTIVMVDPNATVPGRLLHKNNHLHYRFYTMEGIAKTPEEWAAHIKKAREYAQSFKR